MNKALEYFDHMVHCDQLDRDGEKPKCDLIRNQLKCIDILQKHFIFKISKEFELNGNVWGMLVRIQAKDEGDWDCTCANIVDYEEDFDVLKEVFSK